MPVRPLVFCCPLQGARIDQQTYKEVVGLDDEEVDPKMALMSEPIVGIEKVVYDEATGSGAIPARPLTSPKSMSAAQRAVHDITHMPYHPGCEICVSCRRPNTQHRSHKLSERTVPLMVGDYAFPKHSEDSGPMTVLVIHVFPTNCFWWCLSHAKDATHMWCSAWRASSRSVAYFISPIGAIENQQSLL